METDDQGRRVFVMPDGYRFLFDPLPAPRRPA
jgi:hypothetical protein